MRKLIPLLLLAACAPKQKPPEVSSPVESNITVCVIDTLAPGGMMNVGAIYSRATNDTVVVQSSGRVKLSQIVGSPKTLSAATWITAKQPLQLVAASGRVRFMPSGAAKTMAPGSIVLLGMMRGLPVFALPNEGGPMRPELESLAAKGVDLERALSQRLTLRRQLDKVRSLYIPVSLTGCQFQTFARARR